MWVYFLRHQVSGGSIRSEAKGSEFLPGKDQAGILSRYLTEGTGDHLGAYDISHSFVFSQWYEEFPHLL